MPGFRKSLNYSVVSNSKGCMSPVFCSFYKVFYISYTIHVTEFSMTMQFNTFFRTCIYPFHCKIINFNCTINRTYTYIIVKFIISGRTTYFNKSTYFHVSKQFIQFIIMHKEFYNDGICKICNYSTYNCLFSPYFTLFNINYLSTYYDITHISLNFTNVYRLSIKIPSIYNIWVIRTLKWFGVRLSSTLFNKVIISAIIGF